jgi:hypothetical protein
MNVIGMKVSNESHELTTGSKVFDLGGRWFALITIDTIPTESGVNLLINAVMTLSIGVSAIDRTLRIVTQRMRWPVRLFAPGSVSNCKF